MSDKKCTRCERAVQTKMLFMGVQEDVEFDIHEARGFRVYEAPFVCSACEAERAKREDE